MRRKILSVFLVSIIFVFPVYVFAGEKPIVSAQSTILINSDTLEVVFEKDSLAKHSMASTTKIMTAIVALEQCNIDASVEITDEMVAVEGSSMGLRKGDIVDMKTLIYGMLLESGNDAANAVALYISGSIPKFAEKMNEKAQKIGMKSTNFATPSGLDSLNHFSNAYDMALLGAYAIKNKAFLGICSAKSYVTSTTNHEKKRTMYNHNKMLSTYEGAIGIKTGFTKKSGRCLVSAAQRNGVTLICVTLNAPDDWNDTAKMFDYGFSLVQNTQIDTKIQQLSMTVINGKQDSIDLELSFLPTYSCIDSTKLKITKKMFLRQFEYAPIKSGDIMGYSCYYNNNTLICTVPIIAINDVDELDIKIQAENFIDKFKKFLIMKREKINDK